MRNNAVRKITQGAMLAAIVGVLMVANTFSGMTLFTIIPYIVPIPFILYTKEYGYKAGLMVLFVVLIISLLLTPIDQGFVVLIYGLIGVVYGHGVNRDFSDKVIILYTFIGTLIAYAFMIFVFASVYGLDITSDIEFFKQIIETLRPGLSSDNYRVLTSMMRPILIVLYVLTAFIEAFVIHYLSNILFMYLKKKPVRKIKWSQVHYHPIFGMVAGALIIAGFYFYKNPHPNISTDIMVFIAAIGFIYLIFLGHLFFYSKDKYKPFRLYSIIVLLLTLRFYAPVHTGLGLLTSLQDYWRKPHE